MSYNTLRILSLQTVHHSRLVERPSCKVKTGGFPRLMFWAVNDRFSQSTDALSKLLQPNVKPNVAVLRSVNSGGVPKKQKKT